MEPQETPLSPDDPFAVELRRFLDGRVDPSTNRLPPGNGPVDPIAVLMAEERLESIVG